MIKGIVGTPRTKIKDVVNGKIQIHFEPLSYDIPAYDGEYVVTPTLQQQTLATRNKILLENVIVEPSPYDSDTTDATATSSEIVKDKIAYVNKEKITGIMPDNGAVSYSLSNVSESYTIPEGYHNGEGQISIDSSNVDTNNIKSGSNVLGIQGTMPNNGAVFSSLSNISEQYVIPEGYHNGEGYVAINISSVNAKNIKFGTDILGIQGTMPDRGSVDISLSDTSQRYIIPQGYHDGTGSVEISSAEQEKIIPENIKDGITILGVQGTCIEHVNEYLPMIRTPNNAGGFTLGIEQYTLEGTPASIFFSENEAAGLTFDISLSGATIITGLNDFDSNTSDATATAPEILSGKTAYVHATKITGTMPNYGAMNYFFERRNDVFNIPQGYHNGRGKISIAPAEREKIIPENIKKNVTILGIRGTHEGDLTSDADAVAADILENKTAYVNKQKLIGTMPNNGAVDVALSFGEIYTVPQGYHNGEGIIKTNITYTRILNEAGGYTVNIGDENG